MAYLRFGSRMKYFQQREANLYAYMGANFNTFGDLTQTMSLLTLLHEITLRQTDDPKFAYTTLRILAEKCGVLDKMT
jgi:hypothetical protein